MSRDKGGGGTSCCFSVHDVKSVVLKACFRPKLASSRQNKLVVALLGDAGNPKAEVGPSPVLTLK
jgi:hypothetical protein